VNDVSYETSFIVCSEKSLPIGTSKSPKFLIVLHLPRGSPAIRYRPYLESVNGTTLVDWAVNRFSNLFPVTIAHPDPSELGAFAAAAESAAASVVICCGIEAAFVPSCIFHEAATRHLCSGAHWSTVTGLPKGIAINLYEADLLLQLRDLRLPGKPDNPIALIRRLSAETLRGSAIFPPIRSAVYPASLDRQPRILSIQTAFDVATARIAIERSEDDPERLFEAWIDAAALPAAEPQWPTSPRDDRTRVLFFSNYSGYSGAEEALVETVRALPPEQFDKLAFIPVPGLFSDRMSAAGCQILEWAVDLSAPSALNVGVLADLLLTVKPDVIHLNAYSGMPILAAARVAGIPLVQHLRLPELDPLEEAMQASTTVLAVSEYVRRQTFGLRVPPEKIVVLYDGVNTERLNPAIIDRRESRAHLGIESDRLVVLLAARLERRKRADLFINAIEIVSRSVPRLLGVLAGNDTGDPDWTTAIDQSVIEKNLSRHVLRLGFQLNMAALYAASDVVVSCSDCEPLGCSVLEAMSMALPVVVSDSGGTMELVAQGKTGFVFPAGDAAALAAALYELASQPDLLHAMGCQARAHVLSTFSIDRCASSLADILLSNRRLPANRV